MSELNAVTILHGHQCQKLKASGVSAGASMKGVNGSDCFRNLVTLHLAERRKFGTRP